MLQAEVDEFPYVSSIPPALPSLRRLRRWIRMRFRPRAIAEVEIWSERGALMEGMRYHCETHSWTCRLSYLFYDRYGFHRIVANTFSLPSNVSRGPLYETTCHYHLLDPSAHRVDTVINKHVRQTGTNLRANHLAATTRRTFVSPRY